MARVSKEKLIQLEEWFDEKMPNDLAYKCTLCNETLTHLTKMAEAEVGVGTATVTKMLAERINEHALEHEQVTGELLRQRALRKSGERTDKCADRTNKLTGTSPDTIIVDELADQGEPTWTCTECGGTFPLSQTTCNCPGSQPQEEPPKERKESPPKQDPPRIKEYGCSPIERKVAETGLTILKRHLSMKFHPDKGGTDEEQQTVNFLLEEFERFFITDPERFAGI